MVGAALGLLAFLLAFTFGLYLIAILSLGGMGYHCGVAETTRSPVILMVAIVFSAVMLLIADLDRPHKGSINESQRPIVDLRTRLWNKAT